MKASFLLNQCATACPSGRSFLEPSRVLACNLRPVKLSLPLVRPNNTRRPQTGPVVSAVARTSYITAAAAASTVKIIIQGLKLELTEANKAYIEEKVAKAVSHYEGSVKEVDVKLSVRGGDRGTGPKRQKVEVTVYTLRNGVIRTEDVEENLYASVDLVCDKLTRKLRKTKEKAQARGKWPGRGGHPRGEARRPTGEDVAEAQDRVDFEQPEDMAGDLRAELSPEIVREKRFKVDQMTAVEAAANMEQLGHDFYMFRGMEDGQLQIMYKRKEGGYGVIVPDQFDEE